MNIGLIDVDGHNFPNIALMKLSSWHKAQGDDVEWAIPLMCFYDRIYASKVFTFTPDFNPYEYNAKEVMKGGTGYDIKSKLPPPLMSIEVWTIPSILTATTPFSSSQEGASGNARSALSTRRRGASTQ